MHKEIEELLPFYIAGTLSEAEAARIQQHLAVCASCRRAYDEWYVISREVRAEAAEWAGKLPPLSLEVRRRLSRMPQREQNSNGFSGHSLETTRITYLAPKAAPRRRSWVPATLVAAVLTVILVGGVLLLRLSREGQPTQTAVAALSTEAATLTPTAEQSSALPTTPPVTGTPPPNQNLTPTPTLFIPSPIPRSTTPVPVITQIPPVAPPTTAQPPRIRITVTPLPTTPAVSQFVGPQIGPLSGTPLLPVTPTMSIPDYCSLTSLTGNAVNIYRQPNMQSEIMDILQPGEYRAVFVQFAGWYEIFVPSAGIVGWVPGEQVRLNGPCDLPPPSPTATAAPPLCQIILPAGMSANLYAGPGRDYPIIYTLPDNALVIVRARSSTDGWYRVEFEPFEPGVPPVTGWLFDTVSSRYGPCDALPVIRNTTPSATPTPLPPPLLTPSPTPGAPDTTSTVQP